MEKKKREKGERNNFPLWRNPFLNIPSRDKPFSFHPFLPSPPRLVHKYQVRSERSTSFASTTETNSARDRSFDFSARSVLPDRDLSFGREKRIGGNLAARIYHGHESLDSNPIFEIYEGYTRCTTSSRYFSRPSPCLPTTFPRYPLVKKGDIASRINFPTSRVLHFFFFFFFFFLFPVTTGREGGGHARKEE